MIVPKRLVITIDGGGIRGIIPLILLKQLQRRFSEDFFSVDISWWGTSTGALISGAIEVQKRTGLSFELAVQNVLDIYEFRSAAAVNPHGVSIPTRALNQIISSNFGHFNLREFPKLNIVVSKKEDHSPLVFNSENTCSLSSAIAASCAFPGVFPPVEINGDLFVDGFYNAKNPTLLAYHQELKKPGNLVFLSLGTGELREDDSVEQSVRAVHHAMLDKQKKGELTYFRFNPKLQCAVDSMQNTSAKNILNLRKDVISYISENEDQLRKFLEVIR